MSDKPKKQPWIDYLLDTIEKDNDPYISGASTNFNFAYAEFKEGRLTETELRKTLGDTKQYIVGVARAKHHTDKLLSATIEYIIDPERKVHVDVATDPS